MSSTEPDMEKPLVDTGTMVLTTNVNCQSLNAQQLHDNLVERSYSESVGDTILLQTVNFDPNLFDGLNLDLDGTTCPTIGVSSINDDGIDNDDLDRLDSDNALLTGQLNLLDNLDLQMLKSQQSTSQQEQQQSYLNSSEPLVSSTTTIFYDKDQSETINSDSIDLKYFDSSADSIDIDSKSIMLLSGETSDQSSQQHQTDQLVTLVPAPPTPTIESKMTTQTIATTTLAQIRGFATSNEKVYFTSGPLPPNMTTLSLANMKVVGQNVVAIFSDPDSEAKQQSVSGVTIGQAQHQQQLPAQQQQQQHQQQQQQPTRLIIIEDSTKTDHHQSASSSNTTNVTATSATTIRTSQTSIANDKELQNAISNNKNDAVLIPNHNQCKSAPKGTNNGNNGNIGSSTNGLNSNTNTTSTTGNNNNNGDSNQFTDADSNSGTPNSKSFVPCKVCGDKASGYHYGVTSCEGCKGFFRRSIQKQIEYRCLRDGKCLIIRLNRNRCQYCRFKKCLAVGMSRDSVRYGRVPKKSKEKERLEEKANGVTQAEADQSSAAAEIDSKDLALYDTILTISQAHHANCSYTDDKIKGLSKKPIFVITSHIKLESNGDDQCSSSPDIGSVSESMETQKVELWEQLALLITPCIQRVVEFAKRIPGFSDLTQDDQLILVKLGFFEVWLVHISKTVDFVDNTLTFADGSFLNRKQLELMFDCEFVGTLFHLMSGLNNLALNDTEIGLFSAIILLQSDRPQIYDIKAINKIQENVVEALKVQTNRNHSNDTQTFHKLMLKINELRALGSSHSLHLQWFRSNWLRLKLPPLFAEIFDIPKGNGTFVSMVPTVQQSSLTPDSNQIQQQVSLQQTSTSQPPTSSVSLHQHQQTQMQTPSSNQSQTNSNTIDNSNL